MITMLLPLIFALAGDPTPAPDTAPPTPLREIGRVRSLSACATIVVHANSAIDDALSNDQDLAVAVNHLRTTDIDGANAAERRKRLADLMSFAVRIRTSSSAGDAEVRRLRDMAAAEKDPERKAELKAFADALGGALFRQKLAADDLAKAVTNMDGRQSANHGIVDEGAAPVTAAEKAQDTVTRSQPDNRTDPRPQSPGSLKAIGDSNLFFTDRSVKPVNSILVKMADDFAARFAPILRDEGRAADHSLGATTGC